MIYYIVMHNYKIILFDLDGTLTKSRSLITDEMFNILLELGKKYNVVIVSGAELSQMLKQIPQLNEIKFYIMSQSGNVAINSEGKELWNFKMTSEEKLAALEHIKVLKKAFPVKIYSSEEDTIEDRGSQIVYSAIGHHAPLDEKIKFDPNGQLRKMWLEKTPLKNEFIEARIAGTTSIDYTPRNRNKGANIKRLMETMNWKPKESIYIGDALFEGGNDATVIGVCETKSVSGPEDTLKIIKELI